MGFFVDDEAAAVAHGRRVLLLDALHSLLRALPLDYFELEGSPIGLGEEGGSGAGTS